MHTEPFDFTGADGQRLSGRLDVPEGPARATALFAHCFTCTKASVAAVRIARALALRGITVLRFDFTGLGASGGDFADSTFGANVRDIVAAASALASRRGTPPALLVGHSLGGTAMLAAAADIAGARAVATIGSPYDAQHLLRLFKPDDLQRLEADGQAQVDIGGRPFGVKRSLLDDLRRHDPAATLASLRRPLLVLHSPRDTTVDAANAAAIFQAAKHPKSFVSLDDADHLLTREADAVYAADVIAAWASRYVVDSRDAAATLRHAADDGEVVVEDTGVGDFQVDVRAGGARFVADEPIEVGGLGSGPTPYDLLCAGLGACTVMTLRMYARRKGLALTQVRATVGHRREASATPPDVFERRVAINGELTAEQRARLLEIADRCPVHRTLERGAQVHTGWVEPAAPARAEPAGQHAEDMQRATGPA